MKFDADCELTMTCGLMGIAVGMGLMYGPGVGWLAAGILFVIFAVFRAYVRGK